MPPWNTFCGGGILSINNNSKTYLACGAILAVVAGMGAYTVFSKTENLVPVVVATQNIEPRTQITDSMVKVEEVPALGRSENAIDDTSLVVGGYATTKMYAGETVIQPMVAKQFNDDGSSGLALTIPAENLRAISFPTTASDCVNGKVKKGDYVDIIVNMSQGSLGSNSGITKTIIQGVEVFDVGGENESINTITLLLTLEQAEIVKHAYTLGSVTYALNPGNAQTARTTGIINKSFCERYNFNCVGKQ